MMQHKENCPRAGHSEAGVTEQNQDERSCSCDSSIPQQIQERKTPALPPGYQAQTDAETQTLDATFGPDLDAIRAEYAGRLALLDARIAEFERKSDRTDARIAALELEGMPL